jgi:hypothetical protein
MHSFGGENSWKSPLGRPIRRREFNIKMDPGEREREVVEIGDA